MQRLRHGKVHQQQRQRQYRRRDCTHQPVAERRSLKGRSVLPTINQVARPGLGRATLLFKDEVLGLLQDLGRADAAVLVTDHPDVDTVKRLTALLTYHVVIADAVNLTRRTGPHFVN